MQCSWFREHLQAYIDDAVDEDERTRWRDHLQTCGECRRWAVAIEPTLAFAASPRRESDPRQVEVCTEQVLALIRQDRLRRRLRPRATPWMAAAAALVLMAGAGALWRLQPASDGPATVVEPPIAEAATQDQAPPPQVEVDMGGEDVRIYRFATEEDENTAVLLIVNPALES